MDCGVAPRQFSPDPQVAVSLKALSAELGRCRPSEGGLCAKFHPMGGLTRLDGFVADRASNDIILWGLKERGAPPLMLDDFVVALRAAAGEYVTVENGRRVRYQPGISIDADPNMWTRLSAVGALSDPANQLRYQQICDTPMTLRVDGMPRHTRVSDILLAADYRMKLVNQGRADIPIESFFKGVQQRSHERHLLAIRRGATYEQPEYDVNRYWFSAGRFDYQVSGRGETVFLETSQVVLNHAAERVVGGRMVAAGFVPVDEHAYVCDWTARMEDTYEAERIWREMYNVFRHFALARIIVDRNVIADTRFNDRVLMRDHRIETVHIPDSLPGSNLIYSYEAGGRTWSGATCGGVSVDLDERTLVAGADRGDTALAGERVMSGSGRRSQGFAWEVGL